MIYVTVGTQKFQFNRLLKTIDRLISDDVIREDVFAQTGYSDYKPFNYKTESFLSREKFDSYMEKCDILITHGGVATIITGLKYEKPVIVFPRLAKFGEHVDNHQIQIAKIFSGQNFVMMCGENDKLEDLIIRSKQHDFCKYLSHNELVVKTIMDYLEKI